MLEHPSWAHLFKVIQNSPSNTAEEISKKKLLLSDFDDLEFSRTRAQGMTGKIMSISDVVKFVEEFNQKRGQ